MKIWDALTLSFVFKTSLGCLDWDAELPARVAGGKYHLLAAKNAARGWCGPGTTLSMEVTISKLPDHPEPQFPPQQMKITIATSQVVLQSNKINTQLMVVAVIIINIIMIEKK